MLKLRKYQTGNEAEDTYAKRLAYLQANQEAGIQNEIDRAEMALIGSYQRPQQVFADLPAAQPFQAKSPLTSVGQYAPTLSKYIGSTAPITLNALNLDRVRNKGIDMVGRGISIDDVLQQDQKYRYELQNYYNQKKDEIVNSEMPNRQKFTELIKLKDSFKNDEAINAMYQRVDERKKAFKSIDDIKELDGNSKSQLKQLWDRRYEGIVNPDEYKGVESLQNRYDFNPYYWENATFNPKVEEKINTYLKDFATQKYGWDNGNIGVEDRADGKYIYHTKNNGEREYRLADDIINTIKPVLEQDRDIAAYFRQNAMIDTYLNPNFSPEMIRRTNPNLANKTDKEIRDIVQQQRINDQYSAALKLSTKVAFLHKKDGSDTTLNFNETEAAKLRAKEQGERYNSIESGVYNFGLGQEELNLGSEFNFETTQPNYLAGLANSESGKVKYYKTNPDGTKTYMEKSEWDKAKNTSDNKLDEMAKKWGVSTSESQPQYSMLTGKFEDKTRQKSRQEIITEIQNKVKAATNSANNVYQLSKEQTDYFGDLLSREASTGVIAGQKGVKSVSEITDYLIKTGGIVPEDVAKDKAKATEWVKSKIKNNLIGMNPGFNDYSKSKEEALQVAGEVDFNGVKVMFASKNQTLKETLKPIAETRYEFATQGNAGIKQLRLLDAKGNPVIINAKPIRDGNKTYFAYKNGNDVVYLSEEDVVTGSMNYTRKAKYGTFNNDEKNKKY